MTDVVWFDDERCRDVGCAGGKGASLARMAAESLPVPQGFVGQQASLFEEPEDE
jgi:phosphoenolpyruvate synthase/pyruvate phosphate dikinase